MQVVVVLPEQRLNNRTTDAVVNFANANADADYDVNGFCLLACLQRRKRAGPESRELDSD